MLDVAEGQVGWSTREMAERIAGGDGAAEQYFVQRYQRGVTALVRRHCRPNDPEVADLVQEVLTAVLQRLRQGGLDDPDALTSYLQVSVARLTAASYRRRAQQAEIHAQAALEAESSDAVDNITDLDSAKRERWLRELIAQLPTVRDREVLRRFYIEEQGKNEVCTALGIEPDHFHRVVFRARQRLRERLEGAGIRSASGETVASLETPT